MRLFIARTHLPLVQLLEVEAQGAMPPSFACARRVFAKRPETATLAQLAEPAFGEWADPRDADYDTR